MEEMRRLEFLTRSLDLPLEIRTEFISNNPYLVVVYQPKDVVLASVHFHPGTDGYRKDLLELIGLLPDGTEKYDNAIGNITADEAVSIIDKHYKFWKLRNE